MFRKVEMLEKELKEFNNNQKEMKKILENQCNVYTKDEQSILINDNLFG